MRGKGKRIEIKGKALIIFHAGLDMSCLKMDFFIKTSKKCISAMERTL